MKISFAVVLAVASIATAVDDQPTIIIRGPTVVAFFEPVTQAQLEKDPDTNEALADFQLYVAQARKAFRSRGIDFQQVYAKAFRVRIGDQTTTFRPERITVGYYFVSPGKKPLVEYGVNTDVGLLEIAKRYFGKVAK